MAAFLYTNCSTLAIGCSVYTNSSLTTPVSNGIYFDGITCWTVTSGVIDGTASCTTTTTTTAPPYNYYTLTPCAGGASTDYRSILSLALNDVYAFSPGSSVACYTVTSITAGVNTNDLPTLYGPKIGCEDTDCIQI